MAHKAIAGLYTIPKHITLRHMYIITLEVLVLLTAQLAEKISQLKCKDKQGQLVHLRVILIHQEHIAFSILTLSQMCQVNLWLTAKFKN